MVLSGLGWICPFPMQPSFRCVRHADSSGPKGRVFQVAIDGHVLVARAKGYFPSTDDIVEAVLAATRPHTQPAAS